MIILKPRNRHLANIEVSNVTELIKAINNMPLYSEIGDFVTEIKITADGDRTLVSVKTDFLDKFYVVGYLINESN